jgi:hypothetical protein
MRASIVRTLPRTGTEPRQATPSAASFQSPTRDSSASRARMSASIAAKSVNPSHTQSIGASMSSEILNFNPATPVVTLPWTAYP